MAKKMTKETCEAKGHFWIKKNKSCSKPGLGPVKVTLTREDGAREVKWIRDPLPADVSNVLLRAAIKARQAKLRGNS